jgi:hypothetical protein
MNPSGFIGMGLRVVVISLGIPYSEYSAILRSKKVDLTSCWRTREAFC